MLSLFFCRIMGCLCYTVPLWDQSGPARVYKHCLQVVLAGLPRRQDFIVWKQACIAQSNRPIPWRQLFAGHNRWAHNKQSLAPPLGPPEQWPSEDQELSAHHRGRAGLDAHSLVVFLFASRLLSPLVFLLPGRRWTLPVVCFSSCSCFLNSKGE